MFLCFLECRGLSDYLCLMTYVCLLLLFTVCVVVPDAALKCSLI